MYGVDVLDMQIQGITIPDTCNRLSAASFPFAKLYQVELALAVVQNVVHRCT